jgi:UDP-3-O-[3-hydroxymyristoyl] glucosamine N-acyltransferase
MAVHASADVASSARVDPTANVWHLAQIREGAVIGMDSVVGRAAYIGSGVVLGARCKLQNLAQVYVADVALVAGVPARRIGWVGRAGRPLTEVGDGWWRCEQTGDWYRQESDRLIECVDDPGPTELDRP